MKVGDIVWALNPKYKDGTRLRERAAENSKFNGVWLSNDDAVTILDIAPGFVQVLKEDGTSGWIRERNLTTQGRKSGITKDIITTAIVTPDPEYCMGQRIYGVGIKQDPIPGEKRGKGIQHLTSAYWVTDMAQFICANLKTMQEFVRHAKRGSEVEAGYDYVYFVNMANCLYNKADVEGLQSQHAKELFLMATWLVMAAAEVDEGPFAKYTPEEKAKQREIFYETYLNPRAGPGVVDVGREDGDVLGKYAVSHCRVDLIPMFAMERLGVNNELSALKYVDAEQPLREGFQISKRTDSLKRHFESVHRNERDEDHIIHLLWNMMAIYHVNHIYPNKNDLIDFEAIRQESLQKLPESYSPATSLQKIIAQRFEPSQVLKLDWNEGAIPPPKSVQNAMVSFISKADGHYLKWYPNLSGGDELRNQLAKYCCVIPENILVTNGSDDALILICQTFLKAGKSVVAPVPTYEHFCVNASNTGAELHRLEFSDVMSPSMEELQSSIEKLHPKVVYLVSPNNPLGTHWDAKSVASLAAIYSDCIFIVDEAYHEFAQVDPETQMPVTCTGLVSKYKNVLVTRTFSKAFCLASIRCGYIIAHPSTLELLKVRYNPKSVNSLAQVAAFEALEAFEEYYKPYITATNLTRENFIRDLEENGFTVKNGGGGNFICIELDEERISGVCKFLEEKAIYIRDVSARLPGIIRISIGEDMSRVRECLIASRDLNL